MCNLRQTNTSLLIVVNNALRPILNLKRNMLLFFLHFDNKNFVVCTNGYYGDECKTECGNCLHMAVCDKQNGTCYNGCINHFKEPKCSGKYFSTTCCFVVVVDAFLTFI